MDNNFNMDDLEEYSKKVEAAIKEYSAKKLSLLYDTVCNAIYKDLLHPKYKDKIINQALNVLKKIEEEKDILTRDKFCIFLVNNMTVKISMRKENQWSYWNSMKNYFEIQTFLASGDTFCDVITQDDFLTRLLYEIDFYYGLGN